MDDGDEETVSQGHAAPDLAPIAAYMREWERDDGARRDDNRRPWMKLRSATSDRKDRQAEADVISDDKEVVGSGKGDVRIVGKRTLAVSIRQKQCNVDGLNEGVTVTLWRKGELSRRVAVDKGEAGRVESWVSESESMEAGEERKGGWREDGKSGGGRRSKRQ